MHPTPSETPSLPEILEEMPWLTPRDVAKYLGVSERSVKNWLAAGEAPRPALLALYWHTWRGRRAVMLEAEREIAQYYRRASEAEIEVMRLRAVIEKLERAQSWGPSNSPVFASL